jgi:hypothetical protein
LILLLGAGCGVQQVGVEPGPAFQPPPTHTRAPEGAATARPTQVVRVVTVVPEQTGAVATPTCAAGTGVLYGTLCYPSEFVPAMRVYVENVGTGAIAAFSTERNQPVFAVELPPGSYVAYAHPTEPSPVGGAYTHAVPCGLRVECTDHRLLPFEVRAGEVSEKVQICDWYAAEAVPPPPDPKQVREVIPLVTPTPTAAVVGTLPSGALVMGAGAGYVGVSPDVEGAPLYDGPGEAYARVGQIPGGRSVQVTGVSADGAWWRVQCPDDVSGSCWITADPAWTHPTAPYGP